MSAPVQFFSPSEAAERLGVSAKALRLYEQRGLVSPLRSEAGWRAYGPDDMALIGDIVALRSLGLTLSQVQRLLTGDGRGLEAALQSHQAALEDQLIKLARTVDAVRGLREDIAAGQAARVDTLVQVAIGAAEPEVAFELPWPWGGERFELRGSKSVNYIIGSLGSGKTRLAKRLAEAIPGASFVGLDRSGAAAQAILAGDPALRASVDQIVAWLVEDGAEVSDALVALLVGIKGAEGATVVVDMVEQDLGRATQEALAAYLRLSVIGKRLFLMTRSSSILDLDAIGANAAIILCPANHSMPRMVLPVSGSAGYESVENCLATPEVRARIAQMVAVQSTTP